MTKRRDAFTQELRAPRARRDEREAAPKRRKRNVALKGRGE